MKLPVRSVLLLSLWMLVPFTAWAQSGGGNGAIEVVVVDAETKPVSGAAVEIRAGETGEVRRGVTDGRGRFAAVAMPVGVYTIEATFDGFAPNRTSATLTVGRTQMVELKLALAGVAESVTVEARAPVDSTGAAAGTHIDLASIADLPVRGRKFTEFVMLTPGVVQESDRYGVVIGGQRSINSNISLDGADFNDPLQGNQRGGNESSFFFPQAAVREFQVVRSGAGAETGRTSAGFVNVVTKSGTNTVHGEGLYLNRNKQLTSANAFDERLNNQQNQFGAGFGGPITKDRAFFFGSVEQNFLRVPFVVRFQQQAPGVVVPAELKALEGEKFGTDNPTAAFARLDWHVSLRHRLDLQYLYTRLDGQNSFFESAQLDLAEESNFSRQMTAHGVKAGLVTVASPTVVNELRLQFATDDRAELPNLERPAIVITSFGTFAGDGDRPRIFEARRFQVNDSLTAIRGNHELRAGIDVNITPSRQQHEGRIVGRYDFTTLANYNARVISRYRQTVPSANRDEQFYKGTQHELAMFVHDKVTLTSNVTLSAGLRWEGQWNPQPPHPNPAIVETTRIPNDLKMWQPRLGLTWNASGAGRTIVRVNGGLYNARTPATVFARVFTDNGVTVLAVDSRVDPAILGYLTLPNGLAALPAGTRVPLQRVFGIDADFQNPDTTAASATVEHHVNDAIELSLGYAHNQTAHLQRRNDRNLFPPTIAATGLPIFPATRPNPTIAQLDVNQSNARSQYDALILTASGHRARVQWETSYTYAKNWDDDSNERVIARQTTLNPFNLDAEWAPSKNDVRHSLTASGVAPLPGGVTIAGLLLARSGVPYTAVIGSDQQNDLNDNNDRAIINGQVVGRNTFRQPRFFNLDVRVMKAFRFARSREVQLLVDVLNATRASNKNAGNESVSVFGTPASPVVTAGQMLFAPSTARFGGPRQVQLGMKLVF